MHEGERTEKEQEQLIATATAILIIGLALVTLSSGWFAYHLYQELQKLYA